MNKSVVLHYHYPFVPTIMQNVLLNVILSRGQAKACILPQN